MVDRKTSPESKELSRHILPTSATMIGVCVTLVGLVKVVESRAGPSHVDEYAALAAILFLVSAASSYLSIRYADQGRTSERYERIADLLFLAGLFSITVIAVLFAYEAV
jgi:hypothetical protein